MQGRLLEDGFGIRDGLISRGERFLVLFLCCGQRALLGKIVAEPLHRDFYGRGRGFRDDLVYQTTFDRLNGRDVAATHHQTQRLGHAGLAAASM